jgi:hypothetical protein
MNLIERLSWIWISLEVLGSLGVIIGVAGEEITERRVLPYRKQECLKSMYWIILLVGLTIDLIGVVGTTITSVKLEARVEQLRQQNNEFAIKLLPKAQRLHIGPKTSINFDKFNNVEFEILYPEGDEGASQFGVELRHRLRQWRPWIEINCRPIGEQDAIFPEGGLNGIVLPLTERAGAKYGHIGFLMKEFPTNGLIEALSDAITNTGGFGPDEIGFETNRDSELNPGMLRIVIGWGF